MGDRSPKRAAASAVDRPAPRHCAGRAVVLPLAVPDRSADVRVAFPYALGYRLSKLPAGPEFDALVAQGMGDGTIRIEGDPSRSPFEGHSLHDAIAANTL